MGADPFMGRDQALEIALEAETAGFDYYKKILDTTDDPEIKSLAREFVVEEERGHVAELQKWIRCFPVGIAWSCARSAVPGVIWLCEPMLAAVKTLDAPVVAA